MCILISFSTKNTLIFNYLLIRQVLCSALTHSSGGQRGARTGRRPRASKVRGHPKSEIAKI